MQLVKTCLDGTDRREKADILMTHFELSETQMPDLLDAITDALLTEQQDIEKLLKQYGVPRGSLDGMIHLIRDLREMFVWQQPSDAFVKNLKRELLGEPEGLVQRVRALPGRVQIAAGMALVAGCALILSRRFMDETSESADIPVLQQ